MISVQISKQQAQTLANVILTDIKPYIEAHKEEYEAFLKGECTNQEER